MRTLLLRGGFLLGFSVEALGHSPMTGAVWEDFAFTEIAKWLSLYRPEWTLWFYRDQRQREADFLVQGPWHEIRALDAKWSETPRGDAGCGHFPRDDEPSARRTTSSRLRLRCGCVSYLSR